RVEDLFGGAAPLADPLDVYPYLGHLLSVELAEPALERVRMLDPETLQARYLAALRLLVRALARRRPLALIFDDVHWADPSSTELLIKLLPLTAEAALLLCFVSRPESEAPGWRLVTAARERLGRSLAELTLSPLTEADSRRLVANLL